MYYTIIYKITSYSANPQLEGHYFTYNSRNRIQQINALLEKAKPTDEAVRQATGNQQNLETTLQDYLK